MELHPQFCPNNQEEWREWLQENHEDASHVWLVMYKKASEKHNLSWSEAVDEALCFGWIDSVKKTMDADRFVQYFGKRKPKSNWSKINKEKVKNLIAVGKMTAAGQFTIDRAKADGSWTFLDQVEALIVPEDLDDALAQNPIAKEFFANQSNSKKKFMLYWVISAKRPETRAKRIFEIVESAAERKLLKMFQ